MVFILLIFFILVTHRIFFTTLCSNRMLYKSKMVSKSNTFNIRIFSSQNQHFTGCVILLATPQKNRVPDMGGVLGLCFFLCPMSGTLLFWGVARRMRHPVYASFCIAKL